MCIRDIYILSLDENMADKAVLNYFVIYVLAVPLYLFFNVEVTSSYIPGMDALMYHDSWYLFFFTEVDPLDNGYPSLHVAIPISLLIINRLHVRELGIEVGQWRHREFDLFLAVNVPIYLFSSCRHRCSKLQLATLILRPGLRCPFPPCHTQNNHLSCIGALHNRFQ